MKEKEIAKRKAGDTNNYRIDSKELWWCKTCSGPVMTAVVYHPVWDGVFPCSGGGEVRTTRLPYCPNCEHKPGEQGMPVYE